MKITSLIKEGIIKGFFWSIGVTLGFAFVSVLLVLIFNQLGGIPLIGNFIATIVESTQESLIKRTPIILQ